jgi:hypothetical protein
MLSSQFKDFSIRRLWMFTHHRQADETFCWSLPIIFPVVIHYTETERGGITVMLWTRIREVSGSNLGRDIAYTDRLLVVSSIHPGKCRESTLKYATTGLFKSFPVQHSSVILPFEGWRNKTCTCSHVAPYLWIFGEARDDSRPPTALKLNLNSVALVREQTTPNERPPLLGEISANFCATDSPRSLISVF